MLARRSCFRRACFRRSLKISLQRGEQLAYRAWAAKNVAPQTWHSRGVFCFAMGTSLLPRDPHSYPASPAPSRPESDPRHASGGRNLDRVPGGRPVFGFERGDHRLQFFDLGLTGGSWIFGPRLERSYAIPLGDQRVSLAL